MLKNTKGFSLIELMVTIGIIGVLSLIALPMYSSYMIKIRYTQLMTHALEISKQIEIELNSGNDLALSVTNMFCKPGSIHFDKNALEQQTKLSCAQNSNFRPPEGTLPSGGVPRRLINIFQDHNSFSMDLAIDYSGFDMYELSYRVVMGDAKRDNSITMITSLRGSNRGPIAKLYSTITQDYQIFFKVLVMHKGPFATLYDKESNKKQTHSGWYCGFHTAYASITPLPMVSEMPITCKHIVTGSASINQPIFQEI